MAHIGHTIQITIPRYGRNEKGKRRKPEKYLHYVGEPSRRKACALARGEHAAKGIKDIRAKVVKTHQRDRLKLIQLQPGQVTLGTQIQ